MSIRLVPSDWHTGACGSADQIVRDALHYFAQHFAETDALTALSGAVGASMECLDFSFDLIRGMTPAEALLDHRLNQLFATLSDQPRQGLGRAIRACGLGGTMHVVARFETAFGIEMPLFLLTCRRAAEDRLFRQKHPEPEALVLPD
jgi:methylphosphotriester-DNA--protein-cysteine methyltransferase